MGELRALQPDAVMVLKSFILLEVDETKNLQVTPVLSTCGLCRIPMARLVV